MLTVKKSWDNLYNFKEMQKIRKKWDNEIKNYNGKWRGNKE
jgi:hypothetical protein